MRPTRPHLAAPLSAARGMGSFHSAGMLPVMHADCGCHRERPAWMHSSRGRLMRRKKSCASRTGASCHQVGYRLMDKMMRQTMTESADLTRSDRIVRTWHRRFIASPGARAPGIDGTYGLEPRDIGDLRHRRSARAFQHCGSGCPNAGPPDCKADRERISRRQIVS